jgi:hypothetical protein
MLAAPLGDRVGEYPDWHSRDPLRNTILCPATANPVGGNALVRPISARGILLASPEVGPAASNEVGLERGDQID